MPLPVIAMPELPLTGGCQCGRVRYRINAVPYVFYLCHCTECQRHTSSAFCPECGVRIVHGTAGSDMVNIKAGTLDEASWLVPADHIWTRSRQRFVAIGGDELSYREQPADDYAAMAARWREMLAKS